MLAIQAAKLKSKKVILMPPPPLSHPRLKSKTERITDIMWYEARKADVEFVDVASQFDDERIRGKYVIHRDGLHVTRLGGGIYAWSLLEHLHHHHKQLRVNPQLCAGCQLTGHKFDHCDIVMNPRSITRQPRRSASTTNTSQPRSPPTFAHYNRFNVLNSDEHYFNYFPQGHHYRP